MTTYTESAYIGEWLKSAFDFPNYCVESRTIDQDAVATVGLVSGEVLDGSVACSHGLGATADGILIEPVTLVDLLAGATTRPVLVRGPARIDSDHLTVADTDEKADALVALAALGIIAVNSALTTWNTQTL